MILHYNPNKKPDIMVSEEVKSRLQELKDMYRLHSFSEVIERLLDEREKKGEKSLGDSTEMANSAPESKKKEKKQLPSVNPPQNLFCPECGGKLKGKPRFCHMCGTQL